MAISLPRHQLNRLDSQIWEYLVHVSLINHYCTISSVVFFDWKLLKTLCNIVEALKVVNKLSFLFRKLWLTVKCFHDVHESRFHLSGENLVSEKRKLKHKSTQNLFSTPNLLR